MPYDAVSELPDTVKALPKKGQEIYLSAFNAAFDQYKGDEATAHATAWAAVKKAYKKVGGNWVAKETTKLAKEAKPMKNGVVYCSKPWFLSTG